VRHEPSAFVRAGVGRIPEDRHRDGIIGAMTIAENMTLEEIRSYQRCGLLDRGAMRARARTAIEAYAVKCSGPDAPIGVLSGGNIQKLILARVLERAPRLILANQPTRGLDVGAISEVHRRLLAARDAGAGIVLISEDLDEILALADRIAVMFRGTLTAPQPAGTFDRHGLGALMGGHSEHRAERSEAS
jgi:simple sugar transport system ATP-binding protein